MNSADTFQFESKLKILNDVLAKKKEALIGILNITENQETVLQSVAFTSPKPAPPPESPPGEAAETDESARFLHEMNQEKAALIDQVLKADEVFQGIFDSLARFEEMAPAHKELVTALQQGIKEVMDLDVKIRVQESRNKEANLSRRPPSPIPKATKQYMLSQYAKNKRNRDGD